MKNYRYRSINYPVSPEVVGPELERIWREHGQQLQSIDIVTAARPPDAPLHPCFEWDDAVAAEQHRLQQARTLTRNIQVVVDHGEPQNLFVHVSIEQDGQKQRHYQHVEVILDRPDEYLAGLAELRRKLAELTESFQALKRLAERSNAADGDLRKLATIAEALATARTVAEHLQ